MKKAKSEKTRQVEKKAKKIRSIVMMALLCILMLSAATYAWFTLSDTAKVANLTMTVTEATGLQVAEDKGSAPDPNSKEWSGKVSLQEIKGKLIPATTTDGRAFSKAVYDDEGKVESTTPVTEKLSKETGAAETAEGYYYENSFYIKSLGEDAEVGLVRHSGSLKGDGSDTGTYITRDGRKENDDKTKNSASGAIRVSLTIGQGGSAKTTVYEPDCDDNSRGISADFKNPALKNTMASTAKQKMDGTFEDKELSSAVLELQKDTPTLVTIRIWVEGNDDQCVNQIQLDHLIGQLQFQKILTK